MSLISNQIDGLYGGVNQQSAEQRLITQVEEMINAFPTLDRGLLKRNPTQKLDLDNNVSYTNDMWSYSYDRGLAGGNEEKYSINISDGNLEIINILSGKVYKKGFGLTYDGLAEDYLYPFSGVNGYAATTIKDTTFIVNRLISPKLLDVEGAGATTFYTAELQMFPSDGLFAPYTTTTTNSNVSVNCIDGGVEIVPISVETFNHGYTIITVDGQDIHIDSVHDYIEACLATLATECSFYSSLCTDTRVYPTITYASYAASIFNTLTTALGVDYVVTYDANDKIIIKKLDGTVVVVTYTVTSAERIDKLDYIISVTNSSVSESPIIGDNSYLNTGYVWLKTSNPVNPYTYTIIVSNATATGTFTSTQTTTTAAVTDLVVQINASGNFTAIGKSNVIKITSPTELVSVDASDSWGNQASYGWIYSVALSIDLPKNIGFEGAVVRVTGTGESFFASYWLEYVGSNWTETKDPALVKLIDATTMPHILVRNADDSFSIRIYDKWLDMRIGDDVTNPTPSFIQSLVNGSPTIKDMFFFKNRIGFITDRTVIMSEVGVYGNFWRTTAAAVLDSDYIDAAVDTTKVISLQYATYLEDSMMLFSDKAQFKLSGGRVLSPKDVQIAQTSAYEININIRPLFMNDKIFFCSIRGEYSAIMQYEIKSTSTSSEAIDISAHIQTYIPKTITSLSGSSINNMLFLTSSDADDTVWVYKYYDNGGERVQSAWFKWTYNGNIYNAFSLGSNLNIMINRNQAIAVTDWVVSTGIWDNSHLWDNSNIWIMSPASLTSKDQFETTPIFPQSYLDNFLDDFTSVNNETIIPTVVRIGEWVASSRGSKDIRGHLKFKTVQISSEDGSEFNLTVEDVARSTIRTIKSKYTVNRKPMIYGDAKNIRISITNSDRVGFRINTVSYEGRLTKRDSRR